MRSHTLRLFIALWPPDAVRSRIAQWQSQWQWPERAALVAASQLHVTLHFIGEVAPPRVLDLNYVLRRVPAPRFVLHFGRPEAWSPGIAVLRPDRIPTPLRALYARIGLALAAIDVPVEQRPYRPHMTLAHRAGGARPPPQAPDIDWEVDRGFVLVQSLGGGRGYETVESFGT